MNRMPTNWQGPDSSATESALQELQERIEASGLESSCVGMVCDFCVGQVPLEKAFSEIHQKTMEQMVNLLDARILNDEAALKACLEKIAQESERMAWHALEKGTEALQEGISMLENGFIPDNGYVN